MGCGNDWIFGDENERLALIINSIGKSRGINDESTLVILYKM
jgi:hypothetical protein